MLRICIFCKKSFETDNKQKFFCSVICQRKDYRRRPEIKKKAKDRVREYRRTHPEWKERHRILELTRHRDRRARYWKEYGKRPEVRARIREKENLRRQIDAEFAIADRLRKSLRHAMTHYSKTGKIKSSKKYGINWGEVIKSLKPFPEDLRNFEIDHIIPLHAFNLENPEDIKRAFSPSNLQWLTREENRRKSGKLIIK